MAEREGVPPGPDAAPSQNDAVSSQLGPEAAGAIRRVAAERLGCSESEVDPGVPRRLSGGASRLTYLLEARGPSSTARFVVQMERSGSAGSNLAMASQVQLLGLARQQGVPVPEVLASGGEPGSGFVVLEWLPGEAVVRRIMRDETLASVRTALAAEAGRALAAIHRIDVDRAPKLPSADPVESMRGLLDMLGEPHPAFEIGLAWLEAHRPDPRSPVVTHGDFRMGNLLVSPDGLAAVLDWELAHVGSPIEDLGWFCCRAWRFGSPLRAGGVGTADDLVEGYVGAGGEAPLPGELDWWEAYGTLRWGLICVLQASVHLRGLHRSVELAAIGRRAAECEEDLLQLIAGPSHYEPAEPDADPGGGAAPHDRPGAAELLDAVAESLEFQRGRLEGSAGFEARVSGNVVEMVAREIRLGPAISTRHSARLAEWGVGDLGSLCARIRGGGWGDLDRGVIESVRADVRDKLSVSNPGYWRGDR